MNNITLARSHCAWRYITSKMCENTQVGTLKIYEEFVLVNCPAVDMVGNGENHISVLACFV